jgi:hypothetical protein
MKGSSRVDESVDLNATVESAEDKDKPGNDNGPYLATNI